MSDDRRTTIPDDLSIPAFLNRVPWSEPVLEEVVGPEADRIRAAIEANEAAIEAEESVPEISVDAHERLEHWRKKLDRARKLDKRDVFEKAAAELFLHAEFERNPRVITDLTYELGRDHALLDDDSIQFVMVGAQNKAEGLSNEHADDAEPPPATSPEEYGEAKIGHNKPPPEIEPTPFTYRPAIEIPKRAWLYGRHYLRNCVSVTIAPPGWTKSTRKLTELIAMSLHRALLGEMPNAEGRLRCWYWSGEDEREEVERRIAAICQHHGIDPRELEGWLFYDSFQEIEITIATQGRGGIVIDAEQTKQITDAIVRNNIDVMGIDPLISAHKVPENDNGAMDAVVKAFGKIAAETHCSIDIDHHTRKLAPGQTEVTVEDARGGGGIIGAARSSRIINRMTQQEALNVGLSEVERMSYFRVGRAKANRAPPEASTWSRMVSVPLPNGDNVGTLEAWKYPDAFANVTTADVHWIRGLVSKEDFRADSRADSWVGRPIAERLRLNINQPAAAAQIKQVIKTWIRNGVLATEKREDEHRKERQYIIPGKLKDAERANIEDE